MLYNAISKKWDQRGLGPLRVRAEPGLLLGRLLPTDTRLLTAQNSPDIGVVADDGEDGQCAS